MSVNDPEIRRQHEIMCRVLAESVVAQLLAAGCDAGELIDFGGEVLRIIAERGFAAEVDDSPDSGAGPTRRQEIPYRLTPHGEDLHRIHGPRVTLRPLTDGDQPLLAGWQGDGAIQQSFSARVLSRLTDGTAGDDQESLPRRDFIICDEDDQGIGLLCLHNIDTAISQAEIAKLIGAPHARGKGYAKEATGLVLAYAFDELDLGRVYLRTAGFNLHNIKLNEKIGFHFEGILRGSDILGDRRVDVVLMSILRREFARLFALVKG